MVQWQEPKKVSSDSPLMSMKNRIDILNMGGNPITGEGLFLPFNQMCQEDVSNLVTIDTSSTWQFETPAGSIWKVRQITKKGKRLRSYIDEAVSTLEKGALESLKEDIPLDYGTWEISIDSPPLAGTRPSLKIREEGTKDNAMHSLGRFAIFIVAMQEESKDWLGLLDKDNLEAFQGYLPVEVKPYFKSPIDVRSFGPLYKKVPASSWERLTILTDVAEEFSFTKVQLNWIIVLLLHEACIYINRKSVEQGEEMAKKNAGMVWWSITGGQGSVGKVTNALTKDRHFTVLDSPTSIFLRIQKNENTFANGIVKANNCKLQPTTEPPYGETLCGKRHTNVTSHSRRCTACHRIKENTRRAEETAAVKEADKIVTTERAVPSTSSPDGKYNSGVRSTLPSNPAIPPRTSRQQEEMEWQSKNGAVITIKAPQMELTDDFEILALEYEEMSEQLLTKSTEYAELANKLRTFGQPTQEELDAQAAVDKAIADQKVIAERAQEKIAKDKADILAAITSNKKGA